MFKKIALLLVLTGALTNNALANSCHDYDARLKNYNGTAGRQLDLANCNVNGNDMDEIIDYVNNHPIVDSINLVNNNLHAETAKKLITLKYVSYLRLDNNYLGDEGVHTLLADKRLRELDLGNNQLTDDGVQELAQQPQLISLGLSNSSLVDKHAALLAQSSILYLDISHNNIQDEGAIALSQDKALRSLGICSNKIGTAGTQALSNMPLLAGGTGECYSQIKK